MQVLRGRDTDVSREDMMSRQIPVSSWIALLLTVTTIACTGKVCGTSTSGDSTAGSASGSISGPPPAASLSPDQRRQVYDAEVRNLRDRVARMQTVVSALSAEAVDVEALGRSLKTPEAAFAYVRDGIALEPYAGVMKGASGTLISRGGNAADRSILMAALLAQKGIQSRIAHGALSEKDATGLRQQIVERPSAMEQINRVLPTSLPSAQLDPEEQKSIDAVTAAAATRATAHHTEADASATVLRAIVAKAGLPAGPDWRATQVAALRDHFWVQASVDGRTIDFDPSFAAAQPGQRFTEPAETFAADQLPDALYHRFEIRVVADMVESGRLVRQEIVGAQARADELFNQNIRIAVLPQAFTHGQNEYQASLTLGRGATVAKSFKIRPGIGGATPQKPLGNAAGSVLDAFGGGAEPEPDGGVLGRLSVEIVAKAPVLGDATARRVIMDRLDDSDEAPRLQPQMEDDENIRSLLVQVWDGTTAVGAIHPLVMLRHQLETLTAKQSMMEQALAAKYLGQPFDAKQAIEPRLPEQITQFLFQGAIFHQFVAARETPSARLYHFRPQLALFRHGMAVHDWSKWNESRRFQDVVDLVNLPYGIVATPEDAAKLNLQLGIADATLERALAKDGADFSTIPLLAAADQQKVALMAVRPNQEATVRQLQIPGPIRRVLLDELRRGRTLIAPAGLVELNQVRTFGWWSVDPESGVPLGQMDLGAGQGAVETAKLTEVTSTMSHTISKLYGGIVGCFYMEAGRQLGAEGGRSFHIPATPGIDPEEPLGECIAEKVCEAVIEDSFLAGDVANFAHMNWYQKIGWNGLMMFGPAIVSHFACH